MAEFQDYRDVLYTLRETFGQNTTWVRIGELAKAERADYRTIRRRYGIPAAAKGIDITILAKRKCAMSGRMKGGSYV